MSDGIATANVEATVWIAEVTDKGNALLSKLAEGNTLEITRALSGSGAVDTTLLAQQTAVATPQQTVTIHPVAYPGEKKCKLPITIRNDGLATSYTATNIGVFANDPDEGEILFFLAAADGPGTSIVSETLQPGYSADFDFYVSFGNADGVSVTVDPSNSVTQGAMENYVTTELGKLTPDSEKHVAYAQRAGTADKTQSALTLRLNGGRTEGSNAWTFDGSTGRTINITPEKIGAAPAVESTEYPGCYYRTVGGEPEWINPPMEDEVEYRTTERFQGKPVYTKQIVMNFVGSILTQTTYIYAASALWVEYSRRTASLNVWEDCLGETSLTSVGPSTHSLTVNCDLDGYDSVTVITQVKFTK